MYAVRLLAEFLGTFFFVAIILASSEAWPVAAGLLAAILLMGRVSGGHVNPAVSVTMYAAGKISRRTMLGYVVVQMLGGLAALAWHKYTGSTARALLTGAK